MTGAASSGGSRERRLTVAKVRLAAGGDSEVMFLESARIYRLLAANPRYDEILRRLAEATGGGPVKVKLDRPEGEIIEDIE